MDDLFMSISISDQQFQMRIMLIIDIKNKTNKTLLIAFIVFRFSMMQYLRYYIYLHNFNKRHHNLPITYFITKNKFLFWSRLTRDLENQPRSQKYGSWNMFSIQWWNLIYLIVELYRLQCWFNLKFNENMFCKI